MIPEEAAELIVELAARGIVPDAGFYRPGSLTVTLSGLNVLDQLRELVAVADERGLAIDAPAFTVRLYPAPLELEATAVDELDDDELDEWRAA